MFKFLTKRTTLACFCAVSGVSIVLYERKWPVLAKEKIPYQYEKIKSEILNLPNRNELMKKLESDQIYDIFVIGGGATGCGVAVDASVKGFNVALVERGDFACETSSKSTKLIHGGVRYLQNAIFNFDINEYYLVREALHERKRFIENVAYLTNPLPIMIPIYSFWQVPYYWFGLKVYDLVAGSQFYRSSYFLSRDKSLDEFPLINSDNLWGSVVYYDGQMDDSRVNLILAMSSIEAGATTINYVEVLDLIKEQNFTRVVCKDLESGKMFECKTKIVVNATGPFTDSIRKMYDKDAKDICRGACGTHIILPRYFCPNNMGMLNAETSDGRVLFLLPWNGYTLAGTTDSPYVIGEIPKSSQKDIDFIVKELNRFLNIETQIKTKYIKSAWTGVRPLVIDISKHTDSDSNTASISRNHVIENKGNFITIVGGKWTTYRAMAEDVMKEVVQKFKDLEDKQKSWKKSTRNLQLYGSKNWTPYFYVSLIQHYNLEEDIAKYLSKKYGMASLSILEISTNNDSVKLNRIVPNSPYTVEEIRYCCRNEYVVSLTDIVARRIRLAFLDSNEAFLLLKQISDIVADELKWGESKKQSELEAAKSYIKNETGLDLINQQK